MPSFTHPCIPQEVSPSLLGHCPCSSGLPGPTGRLFPSSRLIYSYYFLGLGKLEDSESNDASLLGTKESLKILLIVNSTEMSLPPGSPPWLHHPLSYENIATGLRSYIIPLHEFILGGNAFQITKSLQYSFKTQVVSNWKCLIYAFIHVSILLTNIYWDLLCATRWPRCLDCRDE